METLRRNQGISVLVCMCVFVCVLCVHVFMCRHSMLIQKYGTCVKCVHFTSIYGYESR